MTPDGGGSARAPLAAVGHLDGAGARLLRLVRELLGADRVAVTTLGQGRARTLAEVVHVETVGAAPGGALLAPGVAVGGSDDVARSVSLAGHVRDGTPDVRVWRGPAVREVLVAHRWRGRGLGAVAAAALHAPDGAILGALEVGWVGGDAVPDEARLRRAAAVVVDHLGATAERDEYHRFVALAPEALALLDLEGRIELSNPAFADLVGTTSATLRGRSFLELPVRGDVVRVTEALARVLAGRERRVELDAELLHADGRAVPVAISAGHLAGPHRTLQLVVRDRTDRLRAEAERTRLTEQLAQAHRFETVGQVASGLAHDLNNLLAVLLANLDLADETLADVVGGDGGQLATAVDQLGEDLAALRTASGRVEQLTRRLLDLAADRPGSPVAIPLGPRLAAIAEVLAGSLDGVVLERALAPELPVVEVDPVQLERAVTNLVLNARAALGAAGGRIWLAAHTEQRAVPGGGVRELAVVEVGDDGPGMDEETRLRAFDPLFTTRGEHGGTGLGLATVRQVVEEAGGEVHLDTAPGAGTCVTLVLPAVPSAPEPSAETPRLLLVEPARTSREVISAMLAQAGHRVHAVATLDEVLDAPTDDVRALLLASSEETAPTLDEERRAATQAVARVSVHDAELPVVLLTSAAHVTVEGVADVLRKPFASEHLLAVVNRVARDPMAPTA